MVLTHKLGKTLKHVLNVVVELLYNIYIVPTFGNLDIGKSFKSLCFLFLEIGILKQAYYLMENNQFNEK